MPKLRKLRFDSLDDTIADIQTLRSGAYEQGGSWSLPQTCDHLAKTLEVGLRGGLAPTDPWLLRATVFRVVFETILATGYMPSGVSAPPKILPGGLPDGCRADDPEPIDRCLALLAETRDRTAPIPPLPFVVGLSLAKWKRLQRIHTAHHLAFLRPRA